MTLKHYLLNHNIRVVNDGDKLDKNHYKLLKKDFNANDLDYSTSINNKGDVNHKIKFVGILINKRGQVLVSFPKHFIDISNFKNKYEKIKYILKLLKVIFHYTNSNDYHLNNKGQVFSGYPFTAFINIYKYYIIHGLFKINCITSLDGVHGKLLWNKIMKDSKKVVSNNNLIFLPLISKSKVSKINSFVSNCIVYAINHTIDLWGNIKMLPGKINEPYHTINRFYTLNRLENISLNIYRDSDKFLMINLINFFKKLNRRYNSKQYIKCYKFNIVWEYMVNEYLKDCFDGIESKKNKYDICLKFTLKTKKHPNKFVKKNRYYDILRKHSSRKDQLHFQPDHYLPYAKSNSNNAYIFDSKYYEDISKTDYKQISYEFLLSKENKDATNFYNILFMPSEPNKKCNFLAKPYFILKSKFNPLDNNMYKFKKVALYICHLNSITVANHFINEDD